MWMEEAAASTFNTFCLIAIEFPDFIAFFKIVDLQALHL